MFYLSFTTIKKFKKKQTCVHATLGIEVSVLENLTKAVIHWLFGMLSILNWKLLMRLQEKLIDGTIEEGN